MCMIIKSPSPRPQDVNVYSARVATIDLEEQLSVWQATPLYRESTDTVAVVVIGQRPVNDKFKQKVNNKCI